MQKQCELLWIKVPAKCVILNVAFGKNHLGAVDISVVICFLKKCDGIYNYTLHLNDMQFTPFLI